MASLIRSNRCSSRPKETLEQSIAVSHSHCRFRSRKCLVNGRAWTPPPGDRIRSRTMERTNPGQCAKIYNNKRKEPGRLAGSILGAKREELSLTCSPPHAPAIFHEFMRDGSLAWRLRDRTNTPKNTPRYNTYPTPGGHSALRPAALLFLPARFITSRKTTRTHSHEGRKHSPHSLMHRPTRQRCRPSRICKMHRRDGDGWVPASHNSLQRTSVRRADDVTSTPSRETSGAGSAKVPNGQNFLVSFRLGRNIRKFHARKRLREWEKKIVA